MNRKLLILSVLFCVTCVFIYTRSGTEHVNKQAIKQYFEHIDGYKILRHVEMEENVLSLLKLDDYLFTDYQGPNGKITLYIGYYYTADKASAAHSPLICYPSQGWVIEEQIPALTMSVPPFVVNYNEIITSLGKQKELVLYWFQAHHDTNTKAFKNKTNVAYNKLTNKGEQHAFIRVSIPLEVTDASQAKKEVIAFTKEFYPKFIQFINENQIVPFP